MFENVVACVLQLESDIYLNLHRKYVEVRGAEQYPKNRYREINCIFRRKLKIVFKCKKFHVQQINLHYINCVFEIALELF